MARATLTLTTVSGKLASSATWIPNDWSLMPVVSKLSKQERTLLHSVKKSDVSFASFTLLYYGLDM
jgi:hypothetical protein